MCCAMMRSALAIVLPKSMQPLTLLTACRKRAENLTRHHFNSHMLDRLLCVAMAVRKRWQGREGTRHRRTVIILVKPHYLSSKK